MATTQHPHPGHGAPLPPPVIAYAVLTLLTAVLPTAIAGVRPWSSDADLVAFFTHERGAARLQAILTIAGAVPLAVLSAILSDRIRALGLEVPGRLIALVGGAVASALLAASGMVTLALLEVRPGEDLDLLRFGQELSTALGGTAFAAFAGLLVAGVAVTGLLGRLLPPALAWAGLVVALVGQLALLGGATDALDVLVPITRFGSLAFLLAVAFRLGRRD